MTPSGDTPRDLIRRLIEIAGPVCHGNGYELVDVEYTSSPSGWIVRVYIDRSPDGGPPVEGGISFADCERLSRELSAVLDVEDPVPHTYSLEVSSPGFDRPLRTPEHFQRFLGQTARVTLSEPLAGRRNFKGVLRRLEPEGSAEARAIVIDVDGSEFELPLADIGSARLVPDWDALLKKAGRPAKQNPGKRKEQ